jgi:V/A-type H+-transporting ATPase subunit E
VSLDNFVQVILDKGKAEAAEIRARAQAEAERVLSEIRAEGERSLSEAAQRAQEVAQRKKVQDLARAELEARKSVLTAQKEALDEVYQRALARLAGVQENADFLRALLRGNETEWKSGGRVYCAAKDQSLVKEMTGRSFAGTIDCTGGVVIESADGTRRVDLRYESILRDVWNDSVREVAEVLWPSRASKT